MQAKQHSKTSYYIVTLVMIYIISLTAGILGETYFSYNTTIPEKQLLKEVGVQAFTYAYKDLSEDELGLPTCKEEIISKGLDREIQELFDDPSIYFLALYYNDELIGWATADTPKDGLLYGRFMAIKPDFCHKGFAQELGLKLLAIIRKDHCVKKITLMTRNKNVLSCNFYKKHGFKESSYAHHGFTSEHFVGFEIDIDELFKEHKYAANS